MIRSCQAAASALGESWPYGTCYDRPCATYSCYPPLSRSFVCHYVSPKIQAKAAESDSVETTRLLEDAICWSSHTDKGLSGSMCLSIRSSLLLMDSFSSALPAHLQPETKKLTEATFGERLHVQVGRIIWAYGKYVDEISTRYFQGIHRWLPVISRQRFHDRLISFRDSSTAGFSILLLSMYLVTSHPAAVLRGKEYDQVTLYLTTKMLFTQAQAVLPTSTNLVQAGLLIATYEYGHGLTDVAYISIGTCARMALTAGLLKTKFNQRPGAGESLVKELEERNLWWGILLSDR